MSRAANPLNFLTIGDVPAIARPNFVRERLYYALWCFVSGAVEGNLAGAIAAKTFGADKTLTAVTAAAPIFMMTLNVVWGVIIQGRARKPILLGIVAGTALLLSLIAWLPAGNTASPYLFLVLVSAISWLKSGVVTLQSSIWKLNYPDERRGRIVGKLQTIRFLAVPLAGALISLLFDYDPHIHMVAYPLIAGLGLVALIPLRRLRVRGERTQLRAYDAAQMASAATKPRRGVWTGLAEAGRVLVIDRDYRRYMAAQFTLGSANFFTDPILLAILATGLQFDYFSINLLMLGIPGVIAWLAIPAWSPYFDRVGVLRFRMTNCVVWVLSYGCVAASMLLVEFLPGGLREAGSEGGVAAGVLWVAIPILVVGRVLRGAAHGGGVIAWSIGHMQFANPNQIDIYMSIHVGLTGLRSLVMPYAGSLLNEQLGNVTFLVAPALGVVSFLLYRNLAQTFEDRARAGEGVS